METTINYTSIIISLATYLLGSISTLLIWVVQKRNIYREKIVDYQIKAYKELNEVLIDMDNIIKCVDDNDEIRTMIKELIDRFKKENQIFINEKLFNKLNNYFKWFFEQNVDYKKKTERIVEELRKELNRQLNQIFGHR